MAFVDGVGQRALRGVAWAYGSFVGGRLLVLASIAILARLLTPEEFGIVALALVLIALLDAVEDLGVNDALIVIRDEEELQSRARTAWRMSLILGAVLSVVVAATAPLLAAAFDEPQLTAIAPVLGLVFFIKAAGATHYALAQRAMDFRTRTAGELAEVLVRGITGVCLALAGAGAWALVLGFLAGVVARDVVLWLTVPWRPGRGGGWPHLRELTRFGGILTAVDVTAAAGRNIDYVFIGRVLGVAPLGVYTLAWRIPDLLIINLAVVAGYVLFPAFAELRRSSLGDAFVEALRYTSMLVLPLGAALVVLAEPIVLALFGDQWHDAIEPTRILALYAVSVALGIPAGTAYKATGRAHIILLLAVPAVILAGVAIALTVDQGITAVALCQLGATLVYDLAGLALAARLLHVGLPAVGGALAPGLLAALVTAGVLFALERAIEPDGLVLAAAAIVGPAVYAGCLWLLARDALLRLVALARGAVVARAAGPGAG